MHDNCISGFLYPSIFLLNELSIYYYSSSVGLSLFFFFYGNTHQCKITMGHKKPEEQINSPVEIRQLTF
jgi:hypothetical protein